VVELIVRIILEANCGGGAPFGMLLRDTLLGDTVELDLLALAKLGNEYPIALRVLDDRIANVGIGTLRRYNEVPSIDLHDLVLGNALGVEREGHTAVVAVALAVAVSRVQHVLDVLGVERDQPQTVSDQLVGQR